MMRDHWSKIDDFLEARSMDGRTHARARLAWVRFCANTAGDCPATAEDKNYLVRSLADFIGEDNAVEFRLRFL